MSESKRHCGVNEINVEYGWSIALLIFYCCTKHLIEYCHGGPDFASLSFPVHRFYNLVKRPLSFVCHQTLLCAIITLLGKFHIKRGGFGFVKNYQNTVLV